MTDPSSRGRGPESYGPGTEKPGPRGRALFLRYWLPVLAYIALIFGISSIRGTELPTPFPYMDKVAHLLEYSLFGLLAGRAIRSTFAGGSAVLVSLAAIAIGAAVGLVDELYQSTVPGRTSDAADWLADVLAVGFAVVLAQAYGARAVGRHGKRPARKAGP